MISLDYQPWMDDALCAQVDPAIFYPEKGRQSDDAKKICARCPVAAECLEYGLEKSDGWGTWGGLAPEDRKKVLRERRAA